MDSKDEQLNLLVYKSRCNGVATWDMVNSILASSTRNNAANGITGVLVATETHFLQILEGEFNSVNATFERIARDTRHDTLQLINFTNITNRKFGDWAMHGIGLFDLNRELIIRLCLKFGEDNGNVQFPTTMEETMAMLDILLTE